MAEYYGMTIATPGKFDDWEIEDILELSLEEQPKSSITDLFKYHTWDRDRKALVSDNGQMIYKFRQNARFAFYKIVMTPKRKRKNSIKPAGAKRKPSPGTAAYRKKVAAWLDGKVPYNPTAVNKAIAQSRQKIGAKESKAIHALLKGRTNPAGGRGTKRPAPAPRKKKIRKTTRDYSVLFRRAGTTEAFRTLACFPLRARAIEYAKANE